jgi:hypothetical protein
MEPRREIDLATELRALRPAPRPAFATELDGRAAAGFPRRSRNPRAAIGRVPNPFGAPSRLWSRLQAVPRRGLLATGGATAVAMIAAATAVVVVSESGSTSGALQLDVNAAPAAKQGGAGAGSSTLGFTETAPPAAPAKPGSVPAGARTAVPQRLEAPSAGSAEGSVIAPNVAEEAGPGPYAAHVAHRDVERAAQIVLGARPADVRGDAARVFETVQAYGGIVLDSSVRDGAAGEAGASFDLLIPSGRLADAMASFAAIGEVRSRRESTVDVTAPTIALGERLRDAHATISSLLSQLAGAETETERETVEAKLRTERRRAAALRGRLAALRRRTHLSSVSLRIESGGSAGGAGGAWGIGSALGDAGHVLSVAAGVALVGLAVLAPLALICLLAWLAQRSWVRRSRRRALG